MVSGRINKGSHLRGSAFRGSTVEQTNSLNTEFLW